MSTMKSKKIYVLYTLRIWRQPSLDDLSGDREREIIRLSTDMSMPVNFNISFSSFWLFFFVRLSLFVILRTSRFHLISYLLNFVVIFLSSSLFHFLSVFLFLLYTSPSISTLYLSYTFCLFQSVPCRSLVYLISPYMQNGSATNGLIKMGKTKNTNQNITSQIRRAWYTWIYSWEQP